MTTSCGVLHSPLEQPPHYKAKETQGFNWVVSLTDKGVSLVDTTYKEPFMVILTAISVVSVQTLCAGVRRGNGRSGPRIHL